MIPNLFNPTILIIAKSKLLVSTVTSKSEQMRIIESNNKMNMIMLITRPKNILTKRREQSTLSKGSWSYTAKKPRLFVIQLPKPIKAVWMSSQLLYKQTCSLLGQLTTNSDTKFVALSFNIRLYKLVYTLYVPFCRKCPLQSRNYSNSTNTEVYCSFPSLNFIPMSSNKSYTFRGTVKLKLSNKYNY